MADVALNSLVLLNPALAGLADTYAWVQQASWGPCYPVSLSSPPRPIQLTVAEMMRLRFLAQEHPELKAILQKFTAHIEVLVTFDGEP